VSAYLEKSGYGSQAAAPVVKCMYLQMSGLAPSDPVVLSDPLDTSSNRAAPDRALADTRCFAGRFENTAVTE
jgi:penicillin-binding protein 2